MTTKTANFTVRGSDGRGQVVYEVRKKAAAARRTASGKTSKPKSSSSTGR